MKARVQLCQKAAEDHARDARIFAHVYHKAGVICVAPAFYYLPDQFRLGVLLHECGHLALGRRSHSEAAADRAGGKLAGVRILRRTMRKVGMRPARNLEYISGASKPAVLRFLRATLIA